MLNVIIPNTCKPEIEYTFKCLLHEFLGVEFNVSYSENIDVYSISYQKQSILISNLFFHTDNISDLLVVANIPKEIKKNELSIDGISFPIVSLFGDIHLEVTENRLTLSSDIIAATFFMLTRWEENANTARDIHNRFDTDVALSVQHEFLHRPIVNEYVAVLKAMLRLIGYNKEFKKREYTVCPTHDVDNPYMWKSAAKIIRSFAAKIVGGRFKEFANNLGLLLQGKDPYDTFDFLMDMSERAGVKSHFFFMSGGTTKYDNRYKLSDLFVKKLLAKIDDRGHNIGFHPSYATCTDSSQFGKEKEALQNVTSQVIKSGRQHYLMFENPATWKIWNEHGLAWDSTMTHAQKAGFRCGVCYEYPVYDISSRRELQLREKPLIVMEVSLLSYEKMSPEEGVDKVNELKSQVKKYNGEFVFLWHNSCFNTEEWIGKEKVLEACYTYP